MEWGRNPSMVNFKSHILSITLYYFMSKYKLIAIITASLTGKFISVLVLA